MNPRILFCTAIAMFIAALVMSVVDDNERSASYSAAGWILWGVGAASLWPGNKKGGNP